MLLPCACFPTHTLRFSSPVHTAAYPSIPGTDAHCPPLATLLGHICPLCCSRGTSHTRVSLQRVLGRGDEVLAVGAAGSHALQLGWPRKQSRGEKLPLQGKCGKSKGSRCAGSPLTTHRAYSEGDSPSLPCAAPTMSTDRGHP